MTNSPDDKLKKELTIFSLAMAIVNIVIGSGIFVLPSKIAGQLGSSAIIAYLVCGVIMFLVGLCFAEMGSKTKQSGGIYTYIKSSFGQYPGFIANYLYIFGACAVSDAAISNALADVLSVSIPQLASGMYRTLFLFGIFSFLALINIFSVQYGVRIVLMMSLGKLIPLYIMILIGMWYIEPGNLAWTVEPTLQTIGASSLLLYFAFLGVEAPLTNGGEIKNPSRTVPLGMLLGVSIVLFLYICIQLMAQGILGDALAGNTAPLATIMDMITGKVGFTIILIVTIISMFGAVAGEILSVSRMVFAGARDGNMPKILARVHSRFRTPYLSIIVYACIGFTYAISAGFRQLAIISTSSLLLIYLGVCLATIKSRKSTHTTDQKVFIIPGGYTVPILASGAILWLLSHMEWKNILWLSAFIGVFSAIYVIKRLTSKTDQRTTQL